MSKSTTNYSMFKKADGNRHIDLTNLKKVINSIKMRNLLHMQPIVVNSRLEVLDGQHRLAAAEQLNVPIFYDVHEDCSVKDIPALNIQKAWSKEDVLNFFSSQGLDDYSQLNRYIKAHNIPFSLGLALFNPSKKSESNKNAFRMGEYKFPTGQELSDCIDVFSKIQTVVLWLRDRVPGNAGFVSSVRFALALRSFLYIRAVDFDLFMKKIEVRLDLIRPCHSIDSFIQMFKQIYNWKNKNPITTDLDLIVDGEA